MRADAAMQMAGDTAAHASGTLLADLNHEFRTSMNGVAGMLALLLDTELSATQRQYAENALHSASSLTTLIENVVDLSTIDGGRFELARTSFELLPIVQAACGEPYAAEPKKGLGEPALHIDVPPALYVQGDPMRLQQIIRGLLDCADGDVVINAECDADRCCLALAMSLPRDSELLALLNQPDDAVLAALRTHGRAGLALALCKRLARLMGATIARDDSADAQCRIRFSVELPQATAQLAGVRVLIAERNAAEREHLAHLLGAERMRVDTFDTITAALAALAKAAEHDPYRIAILGREIQGMDGEILAAAIKADPAYQATSLVALCDRAGDNSVENLAQSGFSALLVKQATQRDTIAVINSLCTAINGGDRPGFVTAGATGPRTSMAERPVAGRRIAGRRIAGRRILIADDNPINQQVAQRLVEKLGCVADIAADGRQALAMHAACPYDLVLMDCQMPHLDGYQATERIRALDGASRRTPVIALTACATQGEREKCLSKGMDDFIAKPVRPQVLEEVLGRWLAQVPVESTASEPACSDELETVREMFGANFGELARLYLNDSPPRIAALHRAGAAGDAAHVAKVAHAFSGSSVSIGATALSALCRELELRAKESALDDFGQRMAAIEAEYGRISDRLRAMV